MFGGLRQNSTVYVLDKNKPTLSVGVVESISNQYAKFGNSNPGTMMPTSEQVVDVKVRTNDETMDFKQLPVSLCIANSGNVVVSDNRDAVLAEVEGMKRMSQDILDNVPHHEDVVKACEEMIAVLNPQVAREKENDRRIGALEERLGGMENVLTQINDNLVSVLKNSKTK